MKADEVLTVTLEYAVLGGDEESAELPVGATWTFGRAPDCSCTLAIPSLSRRALALRLEPTGAVRLVSWQSGLGRVYVSADDSRQMHVLALGSAPVTLGRGSWSVRVELPPVVMRLRLHVPASGGRYDGASRMVSPLASAERTAHSWEPDADRDTVPSWLAVTALAVTVARYPDLAPSVDGEPMRLGEALRWATGLWCGHASRYWVNERLRESVEAAELVLPPGADRLAAVVAHYEPMLPDRGVREAREKLRRLMIEST